VKKTKRKPTDFLRGLSDTERHQIRHRNELARLNRREREIQQLSRRLLVQRQKTDGALFDMAVRLVGLKGFRVEREPLPKAVNE